MKSLFLFFTLLVLIACAPVHEYDLVIRNGTIYDGSGSASIKGDVAINDDTIEAVGDLSGTRGKQEIDAQGMAVAPGFINMLSWAPASLIEDGRSQSDIRQGVTLEVFGEGISYGPLNDKMKQQMKERQGDIKFDIEWTTLGEYLDYIPPDFIYPAQYRRQPFLGGLVMLLGLGYLTLGLRQCRYHFLQPRLCRWGAG